MSNDLLHNLKFVLEHSPGHLYWLDSDGVYQGCNIEQAKSMRLTSTCDIIGKRNEDLPEYFASQQLIDQINHANEKVLSSGEGFIVEEPLIKLDGSMAHVVSQKIPLRGANQEVIGLIGISIDISEVRKRAEIADSDRSKLRITLEGIISTLPGHVYWKDADGVYLGCNNAQAKSLGVNSSIDVIGKTDFDLPWKEGDAQKFRENDLFVMREGQAVTLEEDAIFNGKPAVVLSQKIPLKDNEGRIFGVLGVSVDITDRKEKERLQLENKLLQEQLDTTRLFAASIAHELRTPWTGVILMNGVLEKMMPVFVKTYRRALDAGLVKTTADYFSENAIEGALEAPEVINESASAAKIFIDMMLMKVSLEQATHVELEALPIVESVSQALALYPMADEERSLVHWNFDENKPLDFMFRGDRTLFNHLIFNLLKNALYYVKDAGKGEITIWLSRNKNHHCLHFKDTGAGMSEAVQANLFKAFFSQTRHGTGVGLAFCKKIMTDFGGKIECKSVQDQYTHFTMTFPDFDEA